MSKFNQRHLLAIMNTISNEKNWSNQMNIDVFFYCCYYGRKKALNHSLANDQRVCNVHLLCSIATKQETQCSLGTVFLMFESKFHKSWKNLLWFCICMSICVFAMDRGTLAISVAASKKFAIFFVRFIFSATFFFFCPLSTNRTCFQLLQLHSVTQRASSIT